MCPLNTRKTTKMNRAHETLFDHQWTRIAALSFRFSEMKYSLGSDAAVAESFVFMSGYSLRS